MKNIRIMEIKLLSFVIQKIIKEIVKNKKFFSKKNSYQSSLLKKVFSNKNLTNVNIVEFLLIQKL